jgi:hypothetical protein
MHGINSDAALQFPPSAQKRKGTVRSPMTNSKHGSKKLKTTKGTAKKTLSLAYTIESIKLSWSEETEYGQSFRAMDADEQRAEVILRLNKGVDKGMKSVIKTKLLDDNYKIIVSEKLQAHLSQCRASLPSMYHAAPTSRVAVMHDPTFLSVGEWVEVDADRSVGYNSEGGIAVIINVHDDLADVK